jgi:hypothetical protein
VASDELTPETARELFASSDHAAIDWHTLYHDIVALRERDRARLAEVTAQRDALAIRRILTETPQ